jgi:hypothetical protein
MKVEKISLEIATLKKQLKTKMPDVIKTKIEAKINRLEKELKGSTLTGVEFARNLLAGKKKVNSMTKTEFNDFVKLLSKKPEYDFLKYLTKQQIKDDLDRVAKPVGWRFRGRTNFATPSKTDIKLRRNVYYENRSNKSDVSRVVRLGKGGSLNKCCYVYGKFDEEKTWNPIKMFNSKKEAENFIAEVNGKAIKLGSGKFNVFKFDEYKISNNKSKNWENNEMVSIVNKMAKGGNVFVTPNTVKEFNDKMKDFTNRLNTAESMYKLDNGKSYNKIIKERDDYYKKSKDAWYSALNEAEEKGNMGRYDVLKKMINNANMYAKGGSLIGNQHKLDRNKNGKIDSEDLRMIRANKMAKGGSIKQGRTFIIGSDTARMYDYDEEELDSELQSVAPQYKKDVDYKYITAMGDDFPNAIQIKNGRMIADKEIESMLRGLRGDGKY